MNNLTTISPIDGRYNKITEPLSKYFSEMAFMRYRLLMEEEYLKALTKKKFKGLATDFSEKDAKEIKKIEQTISHDLKAIEYWMRDKLPKNLGNWIHFGLTSEDASNIAHGLILNDSLKEVMIPRLDELIKSLEKLSRSTANYAMLARTHGQPASPTTFGKEMAVYVARLKRQQKQLKTWKATAKLNGATGNYNALVAAYPKTDWPSFSKRFLKSLGLEPNLMTTQIEPHDTMIELFDILRRINMILIDFDQDIWRYISDNWIVQKAVKGEVGSSTMPHKINPIKFENSEGNLGLANALFNQFALKLPASRLQRDLTDSTVKRSVGTAFAYTLIGYQNIIDGLGRITVNKQAMQAELEHHPELLAEAIQTILRREGVAMPYEKLKELTRGKQPTLADMRSFIDGLKVSDKIKKELRSITPANYTGIASKLAKFK